MQLAFLGLGKMGSRMVEKLLADGHDIVVWNRSQDVSEQFVKQYSSYVLPAKAGATSVRQVPSGRIQNNKETGSLIKSGMTRGRLSFVKNIAELSQQESSRIFWLMLPSGNPTDEVLLEVRKIVQAGDIVIDGGNAFYPDTQKRYELFEKMGVHFLGIGVSGGILAPKNGFPLMAGGSEKGYTIVQPILDSLARPHGGHAYFGTGGVGHYIKMIHNGIEYGMMQAIGEGFGVLDKGPYSVDLEKVADIWTKNTIVSGFLLDRAKDALQKDPKLEQIVGYIEENGEARWTVQLAKKLQVPLKVIADSLKFRQKSQKEKTVQKTFAARMVAALRHEFGGHKVKEK